MAGGKIHHWKHGWIPLDAYARSVLAKRKRKPDLAQSDALSTSDRKLLGKDYRSMTSAEKIRAAEIMFGKGSPKAESLKRKYQPVKMKPKPRTDPLDAATKAYGEKRLKEAEAKLGKDSPVYKALERQLNGQGRSTRQQARLQAAGIAKREVVDGVTFDTYEPSRDDLDLVEAQLHPHEFTAAQKKQIAATVNELSARFPNAHVPRIIGYDDRDRFGVTAWDGRSIHLSARMYDPAVRQQMLDNFGGPNGAIAAAYTKREDAFVRAVITHEFGHVLQMQDVRAKVTASDRANQSAPGHGGARYNWDLLPAVDGHPQTIYSNENEYEWFAEAFADGYLHGDGASESGKWALNMVSNVYGGQAAA